MTDGASAERILVLADDSPGAAAAVRAGTRFAEGLGAPLAILGVARTAEEDSRIETALGSAFAAARERLPSVEVVRATGDLIETARRRLAESPSALVLLGARWKPGEGHRRIAPGVWRLVHSLEPPVLVTPPGDGEISRALFCTGGERFIEDGARFAAKLLAGVRASVTVLHVLPAIPGMYGDRMREEEADVADFLASNSRTSRNVRRQVEIFRSAGVAVELRLATGDVAPRIFEEIRRGNHDLLVVGSSPARGTLRTYMLGDLSRDIVGRAGRAFLVLRSRPPGLLTEIWRSLKEGAAEGSAESAASAESPPPPGD